MCELEPSEEEPVKAEEIVVHKEEKPQTEEIKTSNEVVELELKRKELFL